jgi:hypothetical protein
LRLHAAELFLKICNLVNKVRLLLFELSVLLFMLLYLSLKIRDRVLLQVHLVLGLINDLLLFFDALSILNDSRSLLLKVPSHLAYRLVSPTQLFQQLLVVQGLSFELNC